MVDQQQDASFKPVSFDCNADQQQDEWVGRAAGSGIAENVRQLQEMAIFGYGGYT